MRERLLQFIDQLRTAGVRISVAETLEAVNAVAAAGLTRARMREALAATLIKEEAERPLFDQMFDSYFHSKRSRDTEQRTGATRQGMAGHGGEPGDGAPARRPPKPRREAAASPGPSPRDARADSAWAGDTNRDDIDHAEDDQARASGRLEGSRPSGEPLEASYLQAGRAARDRAAQAKPFVDYSDLDYERARETLEPLSRRFRVRLGRRLRLARRGRLDFRRTIRAATQRGGTMLDLRFRARRPRHIDLLILADISGSVRYSSTLMLELVAGARECFRRVRSFVFIDRLAEAEFEQGHLLMTPPLDLYARSDFGRVLAELWNQHRDLLGRQTLVVILGDGRNNRRPARADLLREIARTCRAVIWLNPEPPDRWGSGDSAIKLYAHEVTSLFPCGDLRELEKALTRGIPYHGRAGADSILVERSRWPRSLMVQP